MTDKTSPHPDCDPEDPIVYDDSPCKIDWDEIHATTQPDFEAGRFAFDTDDHPTEEAAMTAMDAFIEGIIKEAERELAAQTALHAACS